MPRDVSFSGSGPPLSVDTGGPFGAFSVTGPTRVGVSIVGRGLPCANGAEACQYGTWRAPCAATVVQSGGIAQRVEVVLNGPCVLTEVDAQGGELAQMTLSALRMRGVLRLNPRDSAGGPDGGIGGDCGTD